MIDLAKHIRDLLLEQGEVFIPELGGFTSTYFPAHYDKASGKFSPPGKVYHFDANQKEGNDKLLDHLTESEKLSRLEGEREIAEYVKDCWYVLNKGQRLQLMGVGVLSLQDGSIVFETDPKLASGGKYFGLEEIAYPLPLSGGNKKKFKALKFILAGVVVLALALAWLWSDSLLSLIRPRRQTNEKESVLKTDTVLTHFNSTVPPSETGNKDQTIERPPRITSDSSTSPVHQVQSENPSPGTSIHKKKALMEAKAETQAANVPKEGQKFYVVAACFGSLQNAQNYAASLKLKGYDSELFGKTKQGLFMVSLGSAGIEAEAMQLLLKVRREGYPDAVIKRY